MTGMPRLSPVTMYGKDAELYWDAAATFKETGMTPRQLADWQHDAVIFLKSIQPDLDRLATEEARANKAPTGQPKRTAHQDRARWSRAAIAKVESQS